MIIYDLECDASHRFEGWFKNAGDYEKQRATKLLICPICQSESVKKLPSVTHINRSRSNNSEQLATTQAQQDLSPRQALQALQKYVKDNFDNVGNRFTEEVKKIHYGESAERNICGTATATEVNELKEEGITTIPLSLLNDKKKLN